VHLVQCYMKTWTITIPSLHIYLHCKSAKNCLILTQFYVIISNPELYFNQTIPNSNTTPHFKYNLHICIYQRKLSNFRVQNSSGYKKIFYTRPLKSTTIVNKEAYEELLVLLLQYKVEIIESRDKAREKA